MIRGLRLFVLCALVNVVCMMVAQSSQPVITDNIEINSQGRVKIVQKEALRQRLMCKEVVDTIAQEPVKVVGYRIQVFSDNNQRTAKNNAHLREQKMNEQFPELKTYIIYKSPTWRVRVGDFKILGEAEYVMHELKEAFPAFAREMMIVKDNINVPEK